MGDLKEPRVFIKFHCKLRKNARETFKMLKVAFGEQTMGRTHVLSGFPTSRAV
jgi:hypothetical protein